MVGSLAAVPAAVAGPLDLLRPDAWVSEEAERFGAWTVRNAPAPDYGESKFGVRLVDVRMETTAQQVKGPSGAAGGEAPRLVLQCPGRPRRDSKPGAPFAVIEKPGRIHAAFCPGRACWDSLAVLVVVPSSGGPEKKPIRWPFYTERWLRDARSEEDQHRFEALTTNAPRKAEQLAVVGRLFVNRIFNADESGSVPFSFFEYAELSPAEMDAVMKPQNGRLSLDFDKARFDKNTLGKAAKLVVTFPTQGASAAVDRLEARCKAAASLNAERLAKVRQAMDREEEAERARKKP